MYEVDFLPIESDGELGSKCGDAIAIRFTYQAENRDAVVVIDGGYGDAGASLAGHVRTYYGTDIIDLVVSTHPDADHINGLETLLKETTVRRLMVHQPRNYLYKVDDFSNIEAVDALLDIAQRQKVDIVEPFKGVQEFDGQFTVLGPAQEYYIELMKQYMEEERTGVAAQRRSSGIAKAFARKALDRSLAAPPIETLGDDEETGSRNNSSVISLLEVDGDRLLFTGDAGIPALESAADYYEFYLKGSFAALPISFFQIPHHGSKHNLGQTILDRILGEKGSPFRETTAFISSAPSCKDPHPSPKVTNAVSRRGGNVFRTEGGTIRHSHNAPPRPDWVPLESVGWLPEDE